MKEILKEDALKEANLIIGAVQNDQIAPVAEFAEKNNIKYVIPFTSKMTMYYPMRMYTRLIRLIPICMPKHPKLVATCLETIISSL